MSANGIPVLINGSRSYWLSSIGADVIHSTIVTDTIDANYANFSTVFANQINASSIAVSTLNFQNSDVSGMFVSSIKGNFGKFSTLQWASDLSGGVGYVNITTDPSGVSVTGDPIIFNNLVYLTSTINIVQVSTIVDTDIFAKNGYFSTLSSGTISTNLLAANQANISSLKVSSLEAIDISGDFAKNWSQFPTLASSITFQPGNVLSNIGTKLFFAGQELTDASGGGADWSVFPAYTDVSMNNFSIRGLSTLQYQDGAKLYSQTGNNLFYNGQPIQFGATSNVSQWANYPAVNTIQTGGFPISSIGNLNLVANSNVRILADSFSTVVDQGIAPAAYSDINLTAQNGLKGRINLTANPGTAGVFGEVNLIANGGTTAGVGTGGLVSITANTPSGYSNLTSAVKISAAGINSYAGVVPSIGSLAGYNFIYGSAGVNICSGLPSVLPNIPLTTYLYGTAGVTTSSDFYAPNIYPYWNGLTTPPDMLISGRYILPNLAQVYISLSNVKTISMDAGASITNLRTLNMSNSTGQISGVSTINGVPFGEVVQSSNIVCSNINVAQSTVTATSYAGLSYAHLLEADLFLAMSSVVKNFQANNILIADNLTGVTNPGFPNQSRLESFSSIQGGFMSTQDIRLSSINGINWLDISGGGGGGGGNTFSTLNAESVKVSTLIGYGGADLFGSTVTIEANLRFVGESAVFPGTGHSMSSLRLINSLGENLNIEASTMNITYDGGPNPNGFVRLGSGSAGDTYIRSVGGSVGISTQNVYISQSTVAQNLYVSSITASPTAGGTIKMGFMEFDSPYLIGNCLGLNTSPSLPVTLNASSIVLGAPTYVSTIYGAPDVHVLSTLITPTLSTQSIFVSSILGNDARPAFTNNITLSTMNLYTASTTLAYFNRVSVNCNVNTSGYDAVVGVDGTYKIGFSFQAVNTGAQDDLSFFFMKNGSVIADSASYSVIKNNEYKLGYAEILETCANGDTINIGLYTTGAGVSISSIVGGLAGDAPAGITSIYKIN